MERTGTTLAAKMVQKAFDVRKLCGRKMKPKKHGPITNETFPSNTALMINIKDPYAWLVSWHAWAVQAGYRGTQIPKRKMPVSFSLQEVTNAIGTFNSRYRNWTTAGYDFAIIRYEDILTNPARLYEQIGELLGVEPDSIRTWTAMPARIIRPARTPMRGLPAIMFDRTYYEEKKYLDLLTPEHIAQLTEEIDWDLLKDLYEPIP